MVILYFRTPGFMIAIPTNLETGETLEKPTPVVFWVHGGGWSGGTLESSHSSLGGGHSYLVQNVGVAVIGTAYRCKGSNGTFSQAMEDIEDVVKWARDIIKHDYRCSHLNYKSEPI